MKTKTKRDYSATSNDARAVYVTASEDQGVAAMKKRISPRELARFLESIEALDEGVGAAASLLHAQVTAGESAGAATAALAAALRTVRDDAKLAFGRNSRQVRAYGAGVRKTMRSADNAQRIAELVLATAAEQGKEAARVGLDAAGIRRLKDLKQAAEEAEQAHASARARRQAATQSVLAAARAVTAETARVRLAASVVFRDDPAKFERYRVALPRHTPRSRTAPTPAPTPPEPAPAPVPPAPTPIVTSARPATARAE